ncbi:MAG: helix-turn-helix domain-containing protein [Hyphomicrobiaceae bacterium]|nr:helix-turn-helix domain-containing protein [Hyphomicrobiaceae bacterium]
MCPTASMITIGVLSAQTGVNIETIRYYEREGLLPSPARSTGGRRVYAEDDVKRLRFLRRCRELGFSLSDARSLLSLAERDAATCAEVKTVVSKHLRDVRSKLAELRGLETALAAMETACPGSDSTDCPILDALNLATSAEYDAAGPRSRPA